MRSRLSLKWSCSNDLTTLAPMIRDSAPTDQNMQLLCKMTSMRFHKVTTIIENRYKKKQDVFSNFAITKSIVIVKR